MASSLLGRSVKWPTSIAVGAAIWAALLWAPGGAPACACGERDAVVVAHGKSLYGVPWRIKAGLLPRVGPQPRMLEVRFSVGPRDSYEGGGYSKMLPLPLHPRFVFSAIKGSDFDDHPEGDLSGVTSWRVSSLVLTMSEGEPLTVHPTPAPTDLRKRLPWLRGARFFDAFFPGSQQPELVEAFDGEGHLLARDRGARGPFSGIARGKNAIGD